MFFLYLPFGPKAEKGFKHKLPVHQDGAAGPAGALPCIVASARVTRQNGGVWKQTGSNQSFLPFTKDGNHFGEDCISFWLLISGKPSQPQFI